MPITELGMKVMMFILSSLSMCSRSDPSYRYIHFLSFITWCNFVKSNDLTINNLTINNLPYKHEQIDHHLYFRNCLRDLLDNWKLCGRVQLRCS